MKEPENKLCFLVDEIDLTKDKLTITTIEDGGRKIVTEYRLDRYLFWKLIAKALIAIR